MSSRLRWVVLALVSAPVLASAHPSALERVDHLSEAIAAHPEEPSNYVRRGQVERDEGHFEAARRDFERAAQLGDPILVAFDLGLLEYRMGNHAAARRHLDAFLARFPGHPQALETRARVARDAGDRAAALADFRAYFARNGRAHPGDYVSAAELLASDEAEDVASALALLDEGMTRLGIVAQLQRPAIALELRRGRIDLALARHESLAPSLGQTPGWKVERAELLLLLDRIDEAQGALDEAQAQLDALPSTRARLRLREQIASLETPPNTLTSEEAEAGWQLLFDGRSFTGWQNLGAGAGEEGAIEGWRIRDGSLERPEEASLAQWIGRHLNPFAAPARDLVTQQRFADFELSLDWRMLGADPPGRWQRARLRVEADRIALWRAGEPQLEIVRGTEAWDRAVADGRFLHVPGYGLTREGHVLLQDHGDPVGYRNIKLRPLAAVAGERGRPGAASAAAPASAVTAP